MDAMMTAMQSGPGVIVARQAGTGFGGCMVAFVETGHVEDFSEHVTSAYLHDAAIQPDIYVVQAVPGAGILRYKP
jgi:galactokinase